MTAPAPAPASGLRITYADAMVALGGLIVFLFSFAPLYSFNDTETILGHTIGTSFHQNSWHTALSVFIVLAALLLIGTAVVDVLWPRHKEIGGFRRHQVQLFLAIYVIVQLIGFALSGSNGEGLGWGAYFMIIGAIVALAGAVLNHFNMLQNSLALPTGGASAPVGYAPNAAYPPPAYPTTDGSTPAAYAPPAQVDPTTPAPVDPSTPPPTVGS
jgi:hypothetical protein